MQAAQCPRCGHARDPRAAMLPTAESLEAGRRNAEWLEAHREDRPAGPAPDLAAFRNPEWPRRWAEIGLVLLAVATLVEVVFDLWHLSILSRDLSVPDNAQAYLDSNDRLDALAVAITLGWLVCAVTFIAWTRRAYRNLPAIGAVQRFKPGWAVGAWFVPIPEPVASQADRQRHGGCSSSRATSPDASCCSHRHRDPAARARRRRSLTRRRQARARARALDRLGLEPS